MHIVLGLMVLILVIMNQLKERPLTGKLYRLPTLLLLVSSYMVSKVAVLGVGDWLILLLGLAITFGFGLIQGRYTRLINRKGVWWVAGSFLSVFAWAASLPIKYMLAYVLIDLFHFQLHLNGFSSIPIYFFSISGFLLGNYTMFIMRYPHLVKNMEQNEQKLRELRAAR